MGHGHSQVRRPPPLPTEIDIVALLMEERQPDHLATAALWREHQGAEVSMATHDAALATAARASGFGVIGAP
jgi:hypothetical protein